MDFKELEIQVKELIAQNKIEIAIKLLTKYFKNDEKLDEIILHSGRYYALRKEQSEGNIGFEEVNKTLGLLRSSILTFLRSEQEEIEFKDQVFQEDDKEEGKDLIKVFFSLGSPHTQAQLDYIEGLKIHLLKYKIDLMTLDGDDWDNLDPLNPIRNKMQKCFGCLALAMERSFVKKGLNKRGSQQESEISDQSFPTPWVQIETTLAYQLKLPFLILKEKDLSSEGMLDENLFEWRIVKIDPANPEELDEYPIKSFIRMWIEEVKKFKSARRNKSA